jgi:cytoskeletal protein RodZ
MSSEYDESANDAHDTSRAGAGAQLRTARETLRLDLAQIAAATRIPVRHLEAIEAGNFEALPSRAYAIGFSRTYAKAVGLDDAAITDVVRGELASGSMQRALPTSAMEPGDPGRLPSSGLAWAAAAAALILAVGAFAYYNTYFAAGTEPGPITAPTPTPTPLPTAAAPVAATGGAVVLTALEDGVWLRLYQEGGARLFERALKRGESVTVPATATDPRINTGRPDALAITVGGQPVAKLSEQAVTLSGVPVSAAVLLARAPAAGANTTPSARQPARRRAPAAVQPGVLPADGTPQTAAPPTATEATTEPAAPSAARIVN